MTTPSVPVDPPALLTLSRAQLASELAPWADRPYRIEQIYRALNVRGVSRFDEMTELGLELRANLAERYQIGRPQVERSHASADGTTKYLFRLVDGATVEAVDIPDDRPGSNARTLCLSSQAGCALGCTFCVTGFWGAGRNLAPGEIVNQVLAIHGPLRGPAEGRLNLVLMGMGEPLANLDALAEALEVLTTVVSWRRITVSTVGIVPGIEAMARWPRRPNLAISLHAPDDERRNEIMPVNRTYPLATLLAALAEYPLERGRRLTFEYLLIRDFNDRESDADALARRLKGLRAKVNLIPINPDPVLGETMVPPAPEAVARFQARLRHRGLIATVRRRRGDQVSAACGQLRAFGRDPRGFRARAQASRQT